MCETELFSNCGRHFYPLKLHKIDSFLQAPYILTTSIILLHLFRDIKANGYSKNWF